MSEQAARRDLRSADERANLRQPVRILFVCLGNICRSPTAEAVMRRLIEQRRLEDEVFVDSAGTGGWHVGQSPDGRATEAARRRGISLGGVAREVSIDDFERFDLILAMDRSNLAELLRLAPDETSREKVRLLREFEARGADRDAKHEAGAASDLDVPKASSDVEVPKSAELDVPRASSDVEVPKSAELDVPDPYYGGPEGFEHVIDLVSAACEGVLDSLGLGQAAGP